MSKQQSPAAILPLFEVAETAESQASESLSEPSPRSRQTLAAASLSTFGEENLLRSESLPAELPERGMSKINSEAVKGLPAAETGVEETSDSPAGIGAAAGTENGLMEGAGGPPEAEMSPGPEAVGGYMGRPAKVTKERLTIHLPVGLIERIKDAVYWTPGLTLAGFGEVAFARALNELERERGTQFRPREAELKGGRPMKFRAGSGA